jgi:hypothetical protein
MLLQRARSIQNLALAQKKTRHEGGLSKSFTPDPLSSLLGGDYSESGLRTTLSALL